MKFVLLINLKILTIANSFLLNTAEHEHFSANKYVQAGWGVRMSFETVKNIDICKIIIIIIKKKKKKKKTRISSAYATKMKVQSNLVISNSHISNYRLSRCENLVPVLTWNYDNR